MKTKISLLSFCLILFIIFASPSSWAGETFSITDMAGRQVRVPRSPSRIVGLSSGCLRILCFLQAQDRVVGIEQFEKKQPLGRSYRYANPSLLNLTLIGPGGPAQINREPDLEALLSVRPEIIFITYMEAGKADALQKKTGIPVVILSYGNFGSFDETFYQALRLAGRILDRQKRAEDIIVFIENARRDLNSRTKKISEKKKERVYVGGIGFRGMQAIESTDGRYTPLAWINADNLAAKIKQDHLFINKEQLLAWKPDVVFVDAFGQSMIKEDFSKNKAFYNAMPAFRSSRVFLLWPFNTYLTNVDTAIIDAYAAGKILFPDKFKDVDLRKKADSVYTFFVGKSVYKDMKSDFGELGQRMAF